MKLIAAVVISALTTVPLQEFENPQYKGWKRFKVGSWVKSRTELSQAGQKVEIEQTTTLLESTAEKLVLEIKSTTKVGGQEFPGTQKQDVQAKLEKAVEIEKVGDETIEVAGKKLACRVGLTTLKPANAKVAVRFKIWVNDDIPGGLAIGEFLPEGAEKPTGTITTLEWEKK